MITRTILSVLLLSTFCRVQSQNAVKEEQKIGMTSDYNYVVSVTPLDESKALSFSNTGVTLDYGVRANVAIRYFDGLGRPIETIQRQAAPDKADLTSIQEYDSYGRESNTWLPAKTNKNGAFIDIAAIKDLSKTTNNDTEPYSYPVYEASPLNTVLSQYGPGKEWHANKKVVDNKFSVNVTGGDTKLICNLYKVAGTGINTSLSKVGTYGAGQLLVISTKNEDGDMIYEFKDKQDRLVLSRQIDGSTAYDTYYVYDDFGRLCYVLPPALEGSTDVNLILQYAFIYKYDARGNCVTKRLPGAEAITYIYDKADRVVFSQDGEQKKKGEWLFTIPDIFGRVVLSGTCTNTATTDANYIKIDGYMNKLVLAESSENTTYKGYTIKINGVVVTPPNTKLLTVNYYDDYRFVNKFGFPNWTGDKKTGFGQEYKGSNKGYESKGLLTGSVIAQLDKVNTYQYSIMRYDYKGNVVEIKSTNHLGGTESEYLAYSFVGQPTKKQHIHTANSKTVQEDYAYSYDHADRLLKTTHKLNNGSEIVLAQNTYDNLGRLQTTTSNGITNSKITYGYNVRSWTKIITSYHFEENLQYTYAGNIWVQIWKQGAKERKYTFGYDALSRLKTASYTATTADGSLYGNSYTYDKNGNIKTLRIHGMISQGKYGDIDRASFEYTGNRLKKITDAAGNIMLEGSSDLKNYSPTLAVQYEYNDNGSMTKDLSKGISGISYNTLNLPQEMVINNPNARAKNYYSYNASGIKLRTVHKFDPKLQANPVIGSTAGDASLITQITQDYVGNKIYKNGVLKQIQFDNGYIEDGKYYFYIKDHLGNNRIVINTNGGIEQSNQYYPYGGLFTESYNKDKQDFKYNGKEYDSMHGLNQYDYSARYYDPAYGRFTTIDPMAEKYYAWSPYAYVANNPMRFIDPTGKEWRNAQHWKRFGKDLYESTKIMFSVGLQFAGEIKTNSAPVGINLNAVSMDLIGVDNGTVRPNKNSPKVTSEFELGFGILGFSKTKSVEESDNNITTKESTQAVGILFFEYQDKTTIEYTENRKGAYVETKSSSIKEVRVPDGGIKVAAIIGIEVKFDYNKIWDALGKLLIDKKSDDNKN